MAIPHRNTTDSSRTPAAMSDCAPAYFLWSLMIINSLMFVIFAFSFAQPKSPAQPEPREPIRRSIRQRLSYDPPTSVTYYVWRPTAPWLLGRPVRTSIAIALRHRH